jgi:hypothetical protein
MNDFKGFLTMIGGGVLRIILFFPAIWQGSVISIRSKKLGDYYWSIGSGTDIWGNKLIAPHANKYWVKPGGRQYGKNEHISLTMALNKQNGFNTPDADKWERRINRFDKDHLKKTLDDYYKTQKN